MSGYKGRFFKKPQDREGSGQNRGGGAAPEVSAPKAQNMTPYLNDINAVAMEQYIKAVHNFSLFDHHYSSLAPWIRGNIPTVMLEHPLSRQKEQLLGRSSKHVVKTDGSTSTVSLTAGEVRTMLIDETIEENDRRNSLAKTMTSKIGGSIMDAESNSIGSKTGYVVSQAKGSTAKSGGSIMDAGPSSRDSKTETAAKPIVSATEMSAEDKMANAIEALFPRNEKRARESERSVISTSANNLLGKMLFLWPTKDIQIKMQATVLLMKAFENGDIIRFVEELRAFSLAGSGNPETNREAAEKHLVSLVMKPGRSLEYFKEFTEAVEHIKVCRSSFTEFKIVDLFFRHLDQKSFPDWYVRFLTDDDNMFRFQKSKFEDAKEHALKYVNNVIRATTPLRGTDENKKPFNQGKSITSVGQLRTALTGAGATGGPITVSPVVLATFMNSKPNSNPNKRNRTDKDKDKVDGTAKKPKPGKEVTDKKVCFKFRDEGKCAYGDGCYFSHVKPVA